VTNVGIDCWALRKNGGGARYVFESIFCELEKNKNYRFLLFLHPEAAECIYELQETVGIFKNAIKIKIESPAEISKYENFVDVFYCPFNNISFRCFNKPVVSLLHDVQERHLPELFSPDDLEGRLEDYDDIVRSSTRTITISEFCKKSIIQFCGGDSNFIDIVYNAPQQSLLKFVNSEKLKSEKNFDLESRSFIFYPANFYPHKNHKRLLLAYKKCLEKSVDMPILVLMGMDWDNNHVRDEISSLGLGDSVRILSGLASENVAWLYSNCVYVILPTLYEGFCMPAVEALAFKKNLLCSDLEILREVTKSNAVFFNPKDINDISNCMIKGISSKPANDVDINNTYSWNVSAQKTLDVLNCAIQDFFKDPKVESDLKSKKFLIFIDASSEDFGSMKKTIESIFSQSYKPALIQLVIVNSLNVEILDIENFKFGSYININFYEDFMQSSKEPYLDFDYFSLIVAGNELSSNYFVNIVRCSRNRDESVFIGELHQIHGDVGKTFETHVYYRINRGNYMLKGCFYPEMYVTRDPYFFTDIIFDNSLLAPKAIKKFQENDCKVIRSNLGKVLYKNSLSFQKSLSRSKRVNFTPTSFMVESEPLSVNKLREDQIFLDYVNGDVAAKLGHNSPPPVIEVKRQLKNLLREDDE
jgi:glycosyltransferase involved in cell wall biosynthesis